MPACATGRTGAGYVVVTRLVFFNRFYAPDHSATAQLLGDLAEHLAAAGCDVTVVTSRALYGDDHAVLPARERRRGVTIIRTWTPRDRRGMAGRIGAYLAYYVTALLHALRLSGRYAVLIAKTDPPLLSAIVAAGMVLRGGRLVCWVQDLFPEVAEAFGMKVGGGASGAMLRFVRNWSLRRAVWVVAIGDLMAARVAALGIPQSRLCVIPNWADDIAILPGTTCSLALRREWGIASDAFVLEYSGNLGRAHEYDTLLGAAERLRDRHGIVFLFVGGGHMSRQLAARVAASGLTSFRFVSYQPRNRLAESIGVGDAHWVSLRPEFEGLIVPSKVFGICAAGRPVIAVCAPDGELPRMLPTNEASIVVAPGDADALAAAIARLAEDHALGDAIGAAGRAILERNYRKASALLRWQALLDGIADERETPLR